MKIKTFSISTTGTSLILISVVLALIFIGSVVAELSVKKELDFGIMKLGESKSVIIANISETITPGHLNITTSCAGGEAISGNLLYFSSGILKTIALPLIGNITFTENIDSGQMNITLTGQKQGIYNCTLNFIGSNTTIINQVDEL